MATGPTIIQPGDVAFHLALAGAWSRAFRLGLPLGRTADHRLLPDTFDAQGAGMAAVLAYFLALDHARVAAQRAPWLDRTLMPTDALDHLHSQAERFRDAYMHFGDKAARPMRLPSTSASANLPRGAVSLSFGFKSAGPYLYAAPGISAQRREWTRLSWAEMADVVDRIESWLLDLLDRWSDVQRRWAPYVEVHGPKLR